MNRIKPYILLLVILSGCTLPTFYEKFYAFNKTVSDGNLQAAEEMLEKNVLKDEAGIDIDPEKTHFFLCGNPKMVENVSGWLYNQDYTKHTRKEPGALHIEEFWS